MDALGHRHCVLHAKPGRHDPQHRPAVHGQLAGARPPAHAVGGYRLHADHRTADPGLGLDCRSVRDQAHLLQRHSAVQLRLVAACAVLVTQRAGGGAGDSGAGWRADAAHRTPDRLTCVSSVGAGTDHGLYHRARSFGTVAGADAWRLDGRVPELALDFPAQYSSRDSRLLRRQTLLPDLPGGGRTRFDGIGFILFGVAMVLITIALEGLGELNLPHMRVVLLLFAGMGCLAAYWLRAGHIESPLFAPSLFRTRTFAVGILGNLFARLGSGALPFLIPLLLQVALGYSPSEAGMSMLPLAAAGMFAKTVARWLIEHMGYRLILTGNTLLLGILLASLALVDVQTPYWVLLVHLGLLGAVNSLQFTAMNTVTLIDLDDASAASGNSLLSVVAQLSLSLGVASAAALLGGFSEEVATGELSSVLEAFQLTFLSVGVLAMFAAGIFLQLPAKEARVATT
ncbi:Drug resistance transporter, EmrB/QacA family [Pseudomonas savastanoi pv. nerii]|nr:Drug resistance transporter, EmrB/QacA family [Pseudomonas savastanoi pv. nerii]